MKETLISFNTAVLAKEKGFNEPCYYYVWSDSKSKKTLSAIFPTYKKEKHCKQEEWEAINENGKERIYTICIPTQHLLKKWLREEHKLHIEIELNDTLNEYYFECLIKNSKDREDVFGVSVPVETYLLGKYQTYEQALEKGLQEALKLI